MGLVKLFKYVYRHPLASKNRVLAFKKLFQWQFAQKILHRPILMPYIGDSVLLVQKGMTGATGNIYTGLHEFEEMAFLLHFLRETDVFFDVGANVGSYSVLSSKVIGSRTLSFEPSPHTFKHLQNNITLNGVQERAQLFNMGIGAEKDYLFFTKGQDTTNHVVLKESENTQKVSVDTLDNLCKEQELIPQLIKIDVEGFETPVIKGASTMMKNPNLKAVIMELNGSGNRYGFDEDQLHAQMIEFGFQSYYYAPFERKLDIRENRSLHGNTIYIRDSEFVKNRISTAQKFSVLEQEF